MVFLYVFLDFLGIWVDNGKGLFVLLVGGFLVCVFEVWGLFVLEVGFVVIELVVYVVFFFGIVLFWIWNFVWGVMFLIGE